MVQRQRLRVLIVGGGIGGLSAAVALRIQGHEVEIFEKSSLNTEVGNAVYCAPNCTAALKHLDVHPDKLGGVVARGFKFLDRNCELQATKIYSEEERASWPAEWWLLTRVDLHSALKQRAVDPSAPGVPVKIHTSSLATGIDGETGRVALADAAAAAPQGDLVVGADGIYSRSRASVVGGEVPLVSAGKDCYRCLIPTAGLLADPETAVFADSPGMAMQVTAVDRRIVLYPCSEGRMTNLVAFVPASEVGGIKKGVTGYDQAANKKQLMDHFKGFSKGVLRMLDMAPEDGVMVWELMDMELQPSLIKSRAVLIGDAAHPFLPYLGQGAAQAIEDGCALGAVLPLGTPPEEVPQRLELWQRLRRDRAQRIILDTRHRGREADGSQGPPQTVDELNASMAFAVQHDAWANGEKALEGWLKERAREDEHSHHL